MLDIKKLERRWLKYKLKSYAPYLILALLLLLSLIAFFIWVSVDKNIQKPITKNPITTPAQPLATTVNAPINDENTTMLEPSMDFVQSFQNTPIPEETPTTVKNKPLQTTTSVPPVPKTLSMPELTPAAVTRPPTISSSMKSKNQEALSINRNNESKLDINELQRRFKETSNANLGLFIARYYYDHGNYDESYNYALKTNNVNNRIDESWIIFAKSLVKLGRADQAKKTLQLYIQQSNSESARGLLDAIERGNFK